MKPMLRHIALVLVCAVLSCAQGCVADRSGMCPDAPELPDNIIGYISVKLMPTDGITRASVGDSFEYGDRNELALAGGNHHFLIFYNEEQEAPVAVSALSPVEPETVGATNLSSTVAFAAIAAKSEQMSFLEKLQECLVILNTDISENSLWTMSKKELMAKVVNSPFFISDKGNRFFTMCNSVYVENGDIAMYTKVQIEGNVYTSYLDAIFAALKVDEKGKDIGKAAVEAYVERLAAKVSVRFNDEGKDIFTPSDNDIILLDRIEDDVPYYKGGYKSRIKITGWGMNALEQESYLFRNIRANGNYFDKWYSVDNKRAYWSEDCNYGKAVYPWQLRRAADKASIPYYNGSNNILRNLSYYELNSGKFGKENSLYAPENTYDFTDASFNTSLDSRAEVLAGTHVVICAELQTDLQDGKGFESRDLYRDRNGNFYLSEKECFKALVLSLNNSLKSHAFLKYKYYDWDKGGGGETLFAWTKGDCCLYYNDTKLTADNIDRLAGKLTSDATVEGGDGQRLVWLDGMSIKDEAGRDIAIYSNIDEVDESKNRYERGSTPNDIKSILLEYIGVVDHFKDGKMYYAVPVGYVLDEQNSTNTSSAYKIYGVVRNCVYDIVIHDVTGLGTSVDNDTEPIVPNKVSTHDHLYISFEILQWHETDQRVPGVIS